MVLIILTPLALFAGCIGSEDDNQNVQSAAVTEHGHSGNGPLKITEEQIGVVHLEPSGSTNQIHPGSDSGGQGVDLIQYQIDEDGVRQICFNDDDGEPHRVVLKDADGNEIAQVTADQDCISVDLEKGTYKMEIHHGGDPDDDQADTVFVRSMAAAGSEAAMSGGEVYGAAYPTASIGDIIWLFLTQECENCDLTNAYLPYASLDGAILSGTDFSYANLQQASFAGTHIDGAVFSGADLTDAHLSPSDAIDSSFGNIGSDAPHGPIPAAKLDRTVLGGNFRESIFNGCDLSSTTIDCGVDFTGISMADTRWQNDITDHFPHGGYSGCRVIFSETILPLDLFTPDSYKHFILDRATLTAPDNYEMAILDLSYTSAQETVFPETLTITENLVMTNTWLANTDLSKFHLGDSVEINLDGAGLAGATLNGMNLSNGSFVATVFNGAQMVEVQMDDATATNAQFRSANLIYASFKNTDLTNAVFSRASSNDPKTYLDYVYMPEATLDGADLTGVEAPYAHIYGGLMTNAKFQGANLSNAILANVNLGGADADMADVNLTGAVLINSTLDGVNLSNASMAATHLEGASFAGATLYGVDLTNASISTANGHYSVNVMDGVSNTLIAHTLNFGATVFPDNITDSNTHCPNLFPGPCAGDALIAPSPPSPPACVPSGSHWCPRPRLPVAQE